MARSSAFGSRSRWAPSASLTGRVYRGALASEFDSAAVCRGARGGKDESGFRFDRLAERGGLYSGILARSVCKQSQSGLDHLPR